MRRFCVALSMVVMAVVAFASRDANAQTLCPSSDGPIAGTVGQRVVYGAFDRVAQIYGAATMAEQRLLPALRRPDSTVVVQFDTTGVLGVADVPKCGSKMVSADLATGGLGFGLRSGAFSFFYAGNATFLNMANVAGGNRVLGSFGFPIAGSLASPIAPIYPRYVGAELSMSLDFITGVDVKTDHLAGGAGYIASKGFYLTLTELDIRAFAAAAVTDGIANIPYLKAGISDFDWLIGTEAARVAGSTSLFGRKLQYGALPAGNVAAADVASQFGTPRDFVTMHLEQTSIAKQFDVKVAGSYKPKADLYDASLAWHSVGFVPDELARSRLSSGAPLGGEPCGTGYRVTGGVVKQPDFFFYGVKGGYLPRAQLDVGSGCIAFASISYNDTQILSVFPFARNSVSVSISFTGIGRKTE